jgi:hypothetical protein
MIARLPWVVGTKHPRYIRNYLTSIGLCGMSLGMGLPVEQYLGNTLAQLGGKYIATSQHYSANKMPMKPYKARVVEPSYLVRLSYADAWDIPITEQLELERLTILPVTHRTFEEYDEEPCRRFC